MSATSGGSSTVVRFSDSEISKLLSLPIAEITEINQDQAVPAPNANDTRKSSIQCDNQNFLPKVLYIYEHFRYLYLWWPVLYFLVRKSFLKKEFLFWPYFRQNYDVICDHLFVRHIKFISQLDQSCNLISAIIYTHFILFLYIPSLLLDFIRIVFSIISNTFQSTPETRFSEYDCQTPFVH